MTFKPGDRVEFTAYRFSDDDPAELGTVLQVDNAGERAEVVIERGLGGCVIWASFDDLRKVAFA